MDLFAKVGTCQVQKEARTALIPTLSDFVEAVLHPRPQTIPLRRIYG